LPVKEKRKDDRTQRNAVYLDRQSEVKERTDKEAVKEKEKGKKRRKKKE
jgi:hypothetical protein